MLLFALFRAFPRTIMCVRRLRPRVWYSLRRALGTPQFANMTGRRSRASAPYRKFCAGGLPCRVRTLHFFNCFYGDGTYYRGTESVIGPYYVLGEQYERPLLAAAECHRGQ